MSYKLSADYYISLSNKNSGRSAHKFIIILQFIFQYFNVQGVMPKNGKTDMLFKKFF